MDYVERMYMQEGVAESEDQKLQDFHQKLEVFIYRYLTVITG